MLTRSQQHLFIQQIIQRLNEEFPGTFYAGHEVTEAGLLFRLLVLDSSRLVKGRVGSVQIGLFMGWKKVFEKIDEMQLDYLLNDDDLDAGC